MTLTQRQINDLIWVRDQAWEMAARQTSVSASLHHKRVWRAGAVIAQLQAELRVSTRAQVVEGGH